jgi:Arc/MetJ-type ribon-helix-helix transcriptional regulator
MPEDLGEHINSAMKARKFENTSEFIRHLVREDYERYKAEDELRALLDAGLKSGLSDETVESIWASAAEESTP